MRFFKIRKSNSQEGEATAEVVIRPPLASRKLQERSVVTGTIERPFDLSVLKKLYENSSIFASVCMQIASDVAGRGWRLILREGAQENQRELINANEFLNDPSDGISLREIFYRLVLDWGVFGFSGLEVARDLRGRVAKIYHIPAETLYVTNDGLYVQKVGTDLVYFKKFGDTRKVSAKLGQVGDYPIEELANELVMFKRYTPGYEHYGLPCIVPAIKGLLTLIGVHDFNYSYFENLGIPAYVVKLKGRWSTNAIEAITNFFDEKLRGAENANRTLVLTLPNTSCDAEFQEVGGKGLEGSFLRLLEVLREEILVAYSMPPNRVGLGKERGLSAGAATIEASRIYNTKVIEPLQNEIETFMNQFLLSREVVSYKFMLANLDLRDFESEVKSYVELLKSGVLTPNEVRDRLDLGEPYEGGNIHFRAYRTVKIPDEDREFAVERIEEV